MMAGEKAQNPTHATAIDITADLDKLSKSELKRECANWRVVWDLIDDDVRSFLMRSGEEVYIFKRDGRSFEGKYIKPMLTVSGHEFTSYERLHSAYHKRMFLYQFNSRVPMTNIVDFKFVEGSYDDPRDNEFADKLNAETASQAEAIQSSEG